MPRYIEGENRLQSTLFPESLDEYIAETNSIRVIDRFVDRLILADLGFERAEPSATGRPGYQPAMLLKLYIYGYLNRLQSSRRLERESHRNVELMWLTGRLLPCFKTIAEFRKNNRNAIRRVCVEFVGVCREFDLFSKSLVAIDGSKFKAVNSRDKNFTRHSMKRRMQRLEAHINRYLRKLDAVDLEEPEIRELTSQELQRKIASMEKRMDELNRIKAEVEAHPDKQISLTDPDSRSMAKAGGGSLVGYNVQVAVDSKHHLIAAHEVTNVTSDRSQLSSMAEQAKEALDGEAQDEATDENETQQEQLTVLADAGYYKSEEILACQEKGMKVLVPKTDTSGKRIKHQFTRSQFIYDANNDEYRCPAGERLLFKSEQISGGRTLRVYRTFKCPECRLKAQCTPAKDRQIQRWEHEYALEAAEAELAKNPDAMRLRKQIVEHPFGTIKHWMGSTHFLMKGLPKVQTEMSLHVLSYNLRRAINVLGVAAILEKLETA
jgi:transposase